MKKKIPSILFGLLFLIGFGVLVYPTVSDQWNTYRQSRLINNYENALSQMEPEDYTQEWEKARAYDESVLQNNLSTDVFGETEEDMMASDYWNVLNVAGDGVMGYLSIPKINVELAIYHGTSDTVLQTGIGHLSGTKLPIGGESTHSVLAAHRGLPSARLFTDVDQLVKGDMFYVHVLDEVLAYQVDQIMPMVDRNDIDTMHEAMDIVEGQDYVTLFTCTPYGVNSHRLLVRGTRVPYNGEEDATDTLSQSMVKAVQNYYMLYLILGLSITLLIIAIMRFWFNRKKDRNTED